MTFTNIEIFDLFESNKLLILYLIEQQIIKVDKNIVYRMYFRSQKTKTKYHYFFYPEIEPYSKIEELKNIKQELLDEDPNILINFDKNRKIGENENYFCEMIRNDSIDTFISYVNKTNLSLFTTIKPSIFETNSFLCKNEPSLIEYAAFYGSIQIFQFLKLNNVRMTSSLWYYAIHSQNAELIHLLEEICIQPLKNLYSNCYDESVKCHHNDFANYFQDNYLNMKDKPNYKCICKYYNYNYIPNEFTNNDIFYYLCYYNYYELVDLYIKQKQKLLKL